MKYDELIQLYFERSNALQGYWTLYVVIVGGMLAFSSLRKLPAAVTTLVVTSALRFVRLRKPGCDHDRDSAAARHAGGDQAI